MGKLIRTDWSFVASIPEKSSTEMMGIQWVNYKEQTCKKQLFLVNKHRGLADFSALGLTVQP